MHSNSKTQVFGNFNSLNKEDIWRKVNHPKFRDFNKHIFDIYHGCNDFKGCIAESDTCIANKNCKSLTTFKGESSDSYIFEIFGTLEKNNAYIASALSFDALMGNDSVMACMLNTSSNTVEIKMYWNYHRDSKPLHVSIFLLIDLKIRVA